MCDFCKDIGTELFRNHVGGIMLADDIKRFVQVYK